MSSPSQSVEEAIFEAALKLTGAARSEYLEAVCGGDTALRENVERLLEAHELTDFLAETPQPLKALAQEAEKVWATKESPGDCIGPYKLVKEVGRGGFGTVWMAEQSAPVRRRVALKIIKPGMDSEEVVARFEQERQALALMDHPHIAKVFDAGVTEWGRPYFVMELVQGVTITAFCDEQRLCVADRVALFIRVCHALQHAHQKGIIHRDLKPTNVLVAVDDDGVPAPKLIDFGVAKAINQPLMERPVVTRLEQMIGTPAYMSPEQTEGGHMDIDTRSDIYSLGVMLYEVLTGRLPFGAEELMRLSYEELRRVIQEKEPLRPSTRLTTALPEELWTLADRRETMPAHLPSLIQGDLDWIVMKALEKDRARRYDTANGLANDLQRHLRHEPVLARPPSAPYLLQRFARRHRLAVGASSAVLLALLGGIVASTREARRARNAEALVEKQLKEVGVQSEAKIKALRELQEQMRRMSRSDQAVADAYIEGREYHSGIALLERSIANDPENATPRTVLLNTLVHGAGERDLLPRYILRHRAPVRRACFSPDGQRLLTISGDGEVQLWDAKNGQAAGGPRALDGTALDAHFSPDGTRFLTVTRTTVGLWETATGFAVSATFPADGPLLGAHFIDRGSRVAICTTRSWDEYHAADGRKLSQVLHRQEVRQARMNPDGSCLLTLESSGSARVRIRATGAETEVPGFGEAAILDASFSADGRYFLLIRKGSVEIRKTQSPGEVFHSALTRSVATQASFSPDGTRVLAVEGNAARVFELSRRQWREEDMLHQAQITTACFSRDGLRVVTASNDETARLWDASTSRPIGGLLRHEGGVLSAEFNPDGAQVVTSSSDGTACIWDTAQPYAAGLPLMHWKDVCKVVFSPDGTRILTASFDGSARLWDLRTGVPVSPAWLHQAEVVDACFSADGRWVLTASHDHTARLWEVATGQQKGPSLEHASPVRSARFSPDYRSILTATEGGIAQIWSVERDAHKVFALSHPGKLTTAQFNPDGRLIVTAGEDGSARLWRTESGEALGPALEHAGAVLEAAFSPDGRYLATASADGTARVWATATGAASTLPLRHIGKVRHVAFSPSGSLVATASDDGTARLWSVSTGEPVGTPLRHRADVKVIRFSPDGRKVATGSGDNTARVWDAATCAPVSAILVHASDVLDVAFSPDGSWLVTADGDHTARIWDVATGRALAPEMAQAAIKIFEGIELSTHGVWQAVPPLERTALRNSFGASVEPDPATQATLKWLLAPAAERTLTPRSAVTPRHLAEQILELGNRTAVRSLVRYDPTHPLLPIALARHEASPERAAWLRGYVLDQLPEDPGLWKRAAEMLLPHSPRSITARAISRLSEMDSETAATLKARLDARPLDPPATVAELQKFKLRYLPPASQVVQWTRKGEQWITSMGKRYVWKGTALVVGREGAIFVSVEKPDTEMFISNPTVPDGRSFLQIDGRGWLEHATMEDPE